MRKVELIQQPHVARPAQPKPLVDKTKPASTRPGAAAAMKAAVDEGAQVAQADTAEELRRLEVDAMLIAARASGPARGPSLADLSSGVATDGAPLETKLKRYSPRDDEQVSRDKQRFLNELESTGSMMRALRAIKRTRTCVMAWRQRDPIFDEAWRDVWESRVDELEDSLMQRAVHGYEKPVYQGGQLVGSETVHHPQLGMFLLQRLRAGQYGVKADASDLLSPQEQAERARAFMKAHAELHQPASSLPAPASTGAAAPRSSGGAT